MDKKVSTLILPLIPIKKKIIFPGTVSHFDVGRSKSIKALENAMLEDKYILVSAQRDKDIQLPTRHDIHEVGTIVKVKQMLKMPGESIRILVEGIKRAEIVDYISESPYFEVSVIADVEKLGLEYNVEALKRLVLSAYETYVSVSNTNSFDAISSLVDLEDGSLLADIIASNLMISQREAQMLLDTYDVEERLRTILEILHREIKILGIEKDITERVKSGISKNQEEYYLREQLKVIKKKLGLDKDSDEKADKYLEELYGLHLKDEIVEKLEEEIDRYRNTDSRSPEKANIKTYLDWVFSLPWNNSTDDEKDISKTRAVLAEDHYGLEDVKDRIIEYLATRKMTDNSAGSIICLVGPPGVGKTSIAKSIARSMNRNFVKMSLGGVKDEAEIRGHRRTYVSSMPGRIIAAMKKAKSNNPVFLLDEIDKLDGNFRGDPASALLEVLDPAQNVEFMDSFIEVPFDLSKVIFITTANNLSQIPWALRDRMEVIELSSYTSFEKLEIAKSYLVKKQKKAHGLKGSMFSITDAALNKIITDYTRESGVRNLERTIAKVMRKAVLSVVEEGTEKVRVTKKNLDEFLGSPKKDFDAIPSKNQVGVATGLAWTAVGGVTLEIEVSVVQGNGKLQLTGKMGEVMKESAKTSVSYIRSKAKRLGIDEEFYKNKDIHIHIPEGAVPKDGPSAGITMTTALISALTGRPVDRMIAMTGEITLRGRVLQIGGLREKVLAAIRYGVKTVIIPESNVKDIEKIPEMLRDKIEFYPVKHMDEVVKKAILK